MVKPQQDGVSSHDLPMEELILCLVLLPPPRLIFPSQVPELTPTTLSPKSECPDIWIRLPRHKWPKSVSSIKTQSFFLKGIGTVILWQDYCEKGNLRKSYWRHGWQKIPNWECLFVHGEKGLFLSVYVDDIKLAGKKQNLDPM